MIIGIILAILFIKLFNRMYRKAVANNMKVFANYLYAVIKAANNS